MKNKNSRGQKTQGLIYGIIGMGLYGLYPVYSHLIVEKLDPLIFAGLATLIGSLPLVLTVRIKGYQKYLFSNTKYLGAIFAVAALSGIATLLFFVGTKLTTGINTSLLSQVEPIYSVILAYFVLGEKRRARELGAIALMVFGACVVVFKGFAAINIGDLLIFATPIFYQLSHLVSKNIINELPDITIISAGRLFYGGLALTVIGVAWHPSALWAFFTLSNIIFLVIFALILRTLDSLFWYNALKRLPLSIVSALIPVSLPIAFLGSIIVLKEVPTIQQYIGLFAIMSGLVWISTLHLTEKA